MNNKKTIFSKLNELMKDKTILVIKSNGEKSEKNIQFVFKMEFELNELKITFQDRFLNYSPKNIIMSNILGLEICGDVKIVKLSKIKFNKNRIQDKKKGKYFIEGKKATIKGIIVKEDRYKSLYLLKDVEINGFRCQHLWIDTGKKYNINQSIYIERIVKFYYKKDKLKLGILKITKNF